MTLYNVKNSLDKGKPKFPLSRKDEGKEDLGLGALTAMLIMDITR
jgi:hypothetical protein